MFNNLWYLLFTVVSLSFALLAFKLGKAWLYAYIAASVTLMNIFVLKQIDLFGFAVTGGNVLYSCIFLSTDLLAEHYGRKSALRAVRIGFFVSVFFVAASQFILLFVPNEHDFAQESFETLFSLTPRIVLGSMVAYLVSQHLDIFLFDAIRKRTKGRRLWLRNNGSTFISQAVDSVTFTLIAFSGVFESEVIWQVILFTYLAKLLVAVLDTPFIYLSKWKVFEPLDRREVTAP